MKKYIAYTFFFFILAYVITQLLGYSSMEKFIKPLWMPLLMLYVYLAALNSVTLRVLYLFLALLCVWIGDLTLIYQQETGWFIVSMAGYLFANMLYIIIFRKSVFLPLSFSLKHTFYFFIAATFLIFELFYLTTAWMRWLLLTYVVSMVSMAVVAKLREKRTLKVSYQLVLLGASLCLIAHVLLGYEKFIQAYFFVPIFANVLYAIAQWLLVHGVLVHPE